MDDEGGVSQGDDLVESIENVYLKKEAELTLRLGRTPVRPRCYDRGDVKELPDTPVPVCVPGDFTVRIGDVMPGWVMRELEEEFRKFGGVAEAASGFLSAMHWVEVEVRGFPDLLDGLGRLKGALMAVGAILAERSMDGGWTGSGNLGLSQQILL